MIRIGRFISWNKLTVAIFAALIASLTSSVERAAIGSCAVT
jgi:hypothetical protein